MKLIAAAVVAFSASTVTPARDDLCGHLDRLDRAVGAGTHKSSSIKVTWDWSNWSVACAHDRQAAAQQLCRWLPTHMNLEDPQILISRALACYQTAPTVPERTQTVDTFVRTRSGKDLHVEAGNLQSNDGLPWMRLTIGTAK